MGDIEKKTTLPAMESLLADIRKIIEQGRRQAYAAAEQTAIATYWNIGRRIVEEEQHGEERAKYGTKLITNLSKELTQAYVFIDVQSRVALDLSEKRRIRDIEG